jgi:hypothetical protein
MDRLNRSLAGCGLAFLLAAGGCRSTQPEVPPGRPYTSDGRQAPPVGFSSEPHALNVPGINAGIPGAGGAPGAPQLGTPGVAASSNYGAPTNNQYAAPGYTAGMAPMPPGLGQPGGGSEGTSMPAYGLAAPSTGAGASGMMGMVPGQAPGAAAAPGPAAPAAGMPTVDPGTLRQSP